MTEENMREQIRSAAKFGGWLWYHPRDSRRSTSGWPDDTLVRDGVMLCLELKTEKGRVSVAQRTWLEELEAVPGVEVMIVRPQHMQALLERLVSRS